MDDLVNEGYLVSSDLHESPQIWNKVKQRMIDLWRHETQRTSRELLASRPLGVREDTTRGLQVREVMQNARLTGRQKLVLIRRFTLGETFKQTGDVLCLTRQTIANDYYSALDKLK